MKKLVFLVLSILLLISCDYTEYKIDTTSVIPEEDIEEYRDYIKELVEAAHPGHYTAGKAKHLDDVILGIESVAQRTYEQEMKVLVFVDGYWDFARVYELDSAQLEIYEYVENHGPIKIRNKYPQQLKYKHPYKGE